MDKLLLLTLLGDILTPILISNAGLPDAARYFSYATVLVIIVRLFLVLLRRTSVPAAFWIVVVLSIAGGAVALGNGQDVAATVWGWWLMFRYPLVGLYVYVRPESLDRFAPRQLTWCIRLLSLEVVVQLWQYASGEIPGDGVTGTLGSGSTSVLAILIVWTVALALGNWISSGKLRELAMVASLGIVSSVLGEIKLFPIAAGAMGIVSLWDRLRQSHKLWQLLPYTLLYCAVLAIFALAYNAVVPAAVEENYLSYFSTDALSGYLDGVWTSSSGGYEVGRDTALIYSWERISGDPFTMAVGDGLGARGESKTLGSAGVALVAEDLGLFTGSSLVVIMGELGLVGLLTLLGFMMWAVWVLWRVPASDLPSGCDGPRYALILFSLLWPVWLWYASTWTYPIPILLYWSTLGYCLNRVQRREPQHDLEVARPATSDQSLQLSEVR